MNNPAILKMGGAMLGLKEDIDNALTEIKTLKKEVDDELQKTIMKTSGLLDINKKIEELQLAIRMVLDSLSDNNIKAAEKILRKMHKIIYETRLLLAKGIQKSMLKATQDLAEAENGLILMVGFDDLTAKFNYVEEKINNI
ncbi:MAG: hypothetical protein NUV45_10480 [Tepidanaerobacteraceae bacterium]|jgi:hypothetical protein|nr:hypothetical protein [Tepidanaerobacteraceae bacterium]